MKKFVINRIWWINIIYIALDLTFMIIKISNAFSTDSIFTPGQLLLWYCNGLTVGCCIMSEIVLWLLRRLEE